MRRISRFLVALGLFAGAARAFADPVGNEQGDKAPAAAESESRFMRLKRDEAGQPLSVDTSIVRYAPADGKEGPTVDLVGAVHIGEREYYEQLNERFKDYDVVLYELVAPRGTRIPKGGGGRGGSTLSQLQQLMQQFLSLEFQLDKIDYTAENFVHADLSPEEFAEARKQRGETLLTMVFRFVGEAILQGARQDSAPQKTEDALGDPLTLLLSPERPVLLRRMMAGQFEDSELSMMAFDGPDGSSLITDRNTAALKGLQEQIALGKKKIAIFYGAAHNGDFDKRLREEFGLAPGEPEWLVAWDLTGKSLTGGNQKPADIEMPEEDGIQLLLPPLPKTR